jgi:hypothetical protein
VVAKTNDGNLLLAGSSPFGRGVLVRSAGTVRVAATDIKLIGNVEVNGNMRVVHNLDVMGRLNGGQQQIQAAPVAPPLAPAPPPPALGVFARLRAWVWR